MGIYNSYATDVENLIIKNLRKILEKKKRIVTSIVLKIVWNTPGLTQDFSLARNKRL